MAGRTRRCKDFGVDISYRGQAAKRGTTCAKTARQQGSIENQERRTEQKALSAGTVTQSHINNLRKKQNGKCANCDERFWGHSARQETLDHDIPLIRGGSHYDSNIKMLLCR